SFKRALNVAVFNAVHRLLEQPDMNSTWVKDAVENPAAEADAVADFVKEKFGDKVTSYDPSDPEANKRAVAAGYTVLAGGTLSSGAWSNVRATGLVKPSGQVT